MIEKIHHHAGQRLRIDRPGTGTDERAAGGRVADNLLHNRCTELRWLASCRREFQQLMKQPRGERISSSCGVNNLGRRQNRHRTAMAGHAPLHRVTTVSHQNIRPLGQ